MIAHLGTLLMAVLAHAQSAPSGGFSSPLLQTHQVAPGEPFTVYLGVDSGTSMPISARFQNFFDGSWAPATFVSFGPYLYTGDSQLTILIPPTSPEGLGVLEIKAGDVVVSREAVLVIGFHYLPKTRPGNTEAIRARQYSASRGASDNKMTNPARPGDHITLWGAGLGARPLDRTLSLSINGRNVRVAWTGRTTDGFDLLEFDLPIDDAPLDCYVRLNLQVDRATFFAGLLSTSEGLGSCSHRLGLGLVELATLDDGGYISFVKLSANSNLFGGPLGFGRYEQFDASFANASAVDIWAATPSVRPASDASPVATCHAPAVAGVGGISAARYPPSPADDPRKAVLNGPLAVEIPMDEWPAGMFSFASQDPMSKAWGSLGGARLLTGDWSIDLPADSSFAAYHVAFQIPRQIALTEAIQIPSLTQDFRARWNGSVFRPEDTVYVQFYANTSALVCSIRADAGAMTVAASNLSWLWDSPSATAYLSAPVNGAMQPLQIQQSGFPTRFGAFTWSQLIRIVIK